MVTAPPAVLVAGAVRVTSPLGSVANTARPLTVPVFGLAAPTIGVPAGGAGSKAFSVSRAKAKASCCKKLLGFGCGLAGFIPVSAKTALAKKFARPSNGDTVTAGGVTVTGTTAAVSDGLVSDGVVTEPVNGD